MQKKSVDASITNVLVDVIGRLKEVNSFSGNRCDKEEIRLNYRRIFGKKYVDHPNWQVIASDEEFSSVFKRFLLKNNCCWIDFIGSDSFSRTHKTQVFFSTVTMRDADRRRREVYLDEYNLCLNNNIPVDIFVQLFFKDSGVFEEELKYRRNLPANKEVLLDTLREIQETGFLISFSPDPLTDESAGIHSLCFPRLTVADYKVRERCIDDAIIRRPPSIKEELIRLLGAIARKEDTPSLSDLVNNVARLNRSLHDSVQYIYFLPMIGAEGAIGLFCYGSKKELSIRQRSDISIVAHNILSPFVSSYKSAWENQQVAKESIKSAISAIMSRNMSHNLGSHCMYYTRATLEKLAKEIYGHGPEIRGAARLMGYIQARMDFLATVVSGEYYPYGSVNFKSQIWDILTVDDFSKRHYKTTGLNNKYYAIKENDIARSLDKVSSLLKDVAADCEKETDTAVLSKVVSETEDLVSHLDSLQLDEADMRTSNFLLENLIKSEHFSRESIRDIESSEEELSEKEKHFYLHVRYNGKIFTGLDYEKARDEEILKAEDIDECDNKWETIEKRENEVKALLSKMNIAMPGGIMSVHAFFNIVENLVRNSAKHLAIDLQGRELVTTIAIKDDVFEDGMPKYQFTIFDNKKNGSTVFPLIIKQLEELRILNKDGSINKKSKGLKEMLVAILWLKSNENEGAYSDILSKLEEDSDAKVKLDNMRKYGYEFVKVDDTGEVCGDDAHPNLGLRFTLPRFENCTKLDIKDMKGMDVTTTLIHSVKNKKICAEIIEIDNSKYIDEAKRRFPRLYCNKYELPDDEKERLKAFVASSATDTPYEIDTQKYYYVLKERFGPDVLDYRIVFDEASPAIDKSKVIYFRNHFSTKPDYKSGLDYLYADTESGGNFTRTLKDLYLSGTDSSGKRRTWQDMFFSLKVIESALTRITIIDERLSAGVGDSEMQGMKMKNIRILNLNPEATEETDSWVGSQFKDEDDYTLFLTIHLGLIEKVVGNEGNWFTKRYNQEFFEEEDKPEKSEFFMNLLRDKFGKGREIFISIHSGRGNYSYELEHSLKKYPFINLSALESVFSNSKFLLSQLFYNTIFIGKGEYNQF